MKSDPIPGMYASSGCLLIETGDPRFQEHDGACSQCKLPLWMHEKERVYPEEGPPGSWHYELWCPDIDPREL